MAEWLTGVFHNRENAAEAIRELTMMGFGDSELRVGPGKAGEVHMAVLAAPEQVSSVRTVFASAEASHFGHGVSVGATGDTERWQVHFDSTNIGPSSHTVGDTPEWIPLRDEDISEQGNQHYGS